MTIVRLTQIKTETPVQVRQPLNNRPHNTRGKLRKELIFGLAIASIILGLTTLSAFNGGVSLEAGSLHMTLDASFADGLRLSFVSL